MRTVAVVALSVLTLAGSAAGAEARGFRLRGSTFSTPYRTTSTRAAPSQRSAFVVGSIGGVSQSSQTDPYGRPETTIVARSVMTAEASAPGAEATEASIPPMPPAPIAAKKAAEPWCPPGRIAGQGAGFCLIN